MVCVHKITIKNFKLAFQVGSSPSVHPLIAFECIAMLPPSVIFVFLTKMIACVMCTVGGYPIPHGGGRGVFDELDDNLRSKHNQVWAAIGILIYAGDYGVDAFADFMNVFRF